MFASSHPVNPSFAQLAGARAVGSRRWGSITFSEMERLFQNQLEVTSSSLWLMSGILAMLKRDDFQPSDSTLFNSTLSSVSAALSRQARSAAVGSGFIRAKRRESLLAHTTLPVPEAQRRSLTVAPGSANGLFNEDILAEVVAQVQRSSQISSNLTVSRSLSRGRSAPSSSSPLVGPRSSGAFRGRPYEKRSSSSSRSGGRKRFRFLEVGAIPFSDPYRRLSVPPLAGLEGQRGGAVGGGGAAVWVSHPFPQLTSTVPDSCHYAFLQPLLHQRGCARGGHPRLDCQGCSGASPTSISGLLQPSVCHVEDLGVVASGHRPLPPQSLCGCVPLSDGDHPVCSPVGSSGRLDGLH